MGGALTRERAYLLLALLVVIWGANWPAMKAGLAYITPLWFACARFWLGALCLFVYLAATKQWTWPTRRDWPVIASVGLFQMALFQPIVNIGLRQVPAGRAAVLVYTTPLWVVPGALLFLSERIGALKWGGVAIGLSGIAVLFNPAALDWGDHQVVLGSALLMTAALLWAIALLHIRGHSWGGSLSPLQVTPWQLLFAALLVTPLAFLFEGQATPVWSWPLAALLAYNGPVATAFAFVAATSISRALPAVTSSLSFLGVPAMGILLSALSLGELPDASLLGGFGLILAGVLLVNLAD
ncbi:MAG TPA: DMT family transporter [Myxococcota bacterium]|nr:DMT family transporter [Myxococcota bacterium]